MTSDTKAIIATVVAIGGLVLGQGFYLNARIDDVHRRLDDSNATANSRFSDVNTRINDVQSDIRELRTELRSDIRELRTELQSDIRELRTLILEALKPSEPAD